MFNSPASVLGHSAYPRARHLRAFGAIQIIFDAAQAFQDLQSGFHFILMMRLRFRTQCPTRCCECSG